MSLNDPEVCARACAQLLDKMGELPNSVNDVYIHIGAISWGPKRRRDELCVCSVHMVFSMCVVCMCVVLCPSASMGA